MLRRRRGPKVILKVIRAPAAVPAANTPPARVQVQLKIQRKHLHQPHRLRVPFHPARGGSLPRTPPFVRRVVRLDRFYKLWRFQRFVAHVTLDPRSVLCDGGGCRVGCRGGLTRHRVPRVVRAQHAEPLSVQREPARGALVRKVDDLHEVPRELSRSSSARNFFLRMSSA